MTLKSAAFARLICSRPCVLAGQIFCVLSPAFLAAFSCRASEEANNSAAHSRAHATCSASMDGTGEVSRMRMAEPTTEGVRLTMSASRTSSRMRCFAWSQRVLVSVRSRRRRLSAETTSGRHMTLSPSSVARRQRASTLSLPSSSTNRFANELEAVENGPHSTAPPPGPGNSTRRGHTRLAEPQGVLADGRQQHRSARAEQAMAMDARGAEHAATVDGSSLSRTIGITTGTAVCGPSSTVVWVRLCRVRCVSPSGRNRSHGE